VFHLVPYQMNVIWCKNTIFFACRTCFDDMCRTG